MKTFITLLFCLTASICMAEELPSQLTSATRSMGQTSTLFENSEKLASDFNKLLIAHGLVVAVPPIHGDSLLPCLKTPSSRTITWYSLKDSTELLAAITLDHSTPSHVELTFVANPKKHTTSETIWDPYKVLLHDAQKEIR